jgi:hypothetical protein
MPIDQVTSLPVALADPPSEQAGIIRVAGGRVCHPTLRVETCPPMAER